MEELGSIIDSILIFSIIIIIIITSHLRKNKKIQLQLLKEQKELEQIKHENYLLETEKLRLELEKMKVDDYNNGINKS
ncbi:hypothetical protein [Pallidibacillus pasinlerensis]|uniref:Uncharacterized protein n=1 Tax=Pallidibacillus pasinlerensis TaxID=2703818 RepID=A0ABX0A2U6_9BACI|nr:hypothetical protein [Pallidibacillus pasinlerensis]NCU17765.1 hypothetical protein [Pallidibacillus pasinlerensis]